MRQDLQWYAVLAVGAVAIALAFWGILDSPSLVGHSGGTLVDSLGTLVRFLSFRLVPAVGVVEPLQLVVAKYLWLATVTIGALKAVLRALRKDILISLARYRRNHLVLFGLTQPGVRIAEQVLDAGHRLVVVDPKPTSDDAAFLWKRGATVLDGRPSSASAHLRAGVPRAKAVIACDDAIESNLVAMSLVYEHLRKLTEKNSPKPIQRPLMALPMVEDVFVRREIATNDIWLPLRSDIHIRPFSLAGLAVRDCLNSYHPRSFVRESTLGAPTHIVIGAAELAEEIATGLISRYQPAGASVPRLVLAIPSVGGLRHPALRQPNALDLVADLDIMETDSESAPERVSRYLTGQGQPTAADAVFICAGTTTESIKVASRCRAILGAAANEDTRIFVFLEPVPGADPDYRPLLDAQVDVFGRWASQLDRMITDGPSGEALARAVHDAYLKISNDGDLKATEGEGPEDWATIPESLRESSRSFAAHISVKLRWAGLDATDHEAIAKAVSDEKLVNEWAEMEHRRWCAERLLTGWQHGKETLHSRRINTNLVPWQDLSEENRELTRAMMYSIPEMLSVE